MNLDRWRFHRGDAPGAHKPGFDDSRWRELTIPHDWSIEDIPGNSSPFTATESGGEAGSGWVQGGVGWYRTSFTIDPTKLNRLRFDGVYMNAEVWVDGLASAFNANGYMPFEVDLNRGGYGALVGGEQVTVAVKVNNLGHNTRWYSGSGLYRPVTLHVSDPLCFATDGLFVTLPELSHERARVRVVAEVINRSGPRAGKVRLTVLDPQGATVGTHEEPIELGPGGWRNVDLELGVDRPALWKPWDLRAEGEGSPLYRAIAEITDGDAILDRIETSFGIRRVEVDAVNGLRINGEPLVLKGGCVHHDAGPLGSAVTAETERRRVIRLKELGYNALRTSHNPPSPYLLDACDEIGFLVMDEAFDEWQCHKVPDGLARDFERISDDDLTRFVRRDRNRPSVIFWSIGNEIESSYYRPDTALRLVQTIRRSDPTRPIAAGVCASFFPRAWFPSWEEGTDEAFRHLDVCGYNYQWERYESDQARHPHRVITGTESYAFEAWENWDQVVRHPYVIGDFLWTAIDYYGESGIGQRHVRPGETPDGQFPMHVGVCGDLDLLQQIKPSGKYRQALWVPGTLHLVRHLPLGEDLKLNDGGWWYKWGWDPVMPDWNPDVPVGTPVEVEVYSGCESVRLFLNGKDLGEKSTSWEDRRRARWTVPYEPGELKAIGTQDGQPFETVLRTAGEPVALRATFDDRGGTEGLRFVEIELVDAQGVRVPHADLEVAVEIDGDAELKAFANADPFDVSSVQNVVARTYHGFLLAVFRPADTPTKVQFCVSGIASAELSL